MRLKESADGSMSRPMSAKVISDEKARLCQMDRYVRETMRKVIRAPLYMLFVLLLHKSSSDPPTNSL